ncbi:MAG TPA: RraA family protein [Caulobacteraceae bacterium]|nr:RraA family protein [Caulobacteraceae bacterium]
MKEKLISLAAMALVACAGWMAPQSLRAADSTDSIVEGFKMVEVASVADAMEQLYGQRNYMSHAMRPLATAKFAGRALTVQMKREDHQEGAKASQGMLDAIDAGAPGSVYVMVLPDGDNFAGIGGLMATAMKSRGFVGAVVDGGVRDLPQIAKIQFPVFSRTIVPSTTIGHYRFVGANVPVVCDGIKVNANDIIVADMDGVVVVPQEKAAEVLKKAQELDFIEHSTIPYIEKYHSLKEAVEKFGRI